MAAVGRTSDFSLKVWGGCLDPSGWGFGCEFGYFQQDWCHVDPLGFLRWASVPPDDLITMLNSKFDGLIRPENLHLHAHAGLWHLAIVTNGVRIRIDHTNLYADTVTKPKAMEMLFKKYTFLVGKLLDDLREAEKILVYRTFDYVMSHEKLGQLAAAVNSFGPNILLYVQTKDETNPPFTVEKVHSGLMRGYIDCFARQEGGLILNYNGWEKVCRAAVRVRDLEFSLAV
jgi:hypothetical protein